MAVLLLVRHGITDWNKEGRWHGQTNISLNDEGRQEARKDAELIRHYPIDKVYTSNLKRTQETYAEIADTLHLDVPVVHAEQFNERDYGIYSGKIKWEIEKEIGTEQFNKLRRSWDYPVPEGETLKDVYQRVQPYFEQVILPELKAGKNIMIVSSGNTLRALCKFLDQLPDEQIASKQLNFGEVDVYTFDQSGQIIGKQLLLRDLFQGKH